jgi:hypothetical protein
MLSLALFAGAAAQSRGAFQADLEKAGYTVTVTAGEKVTLTSIDPERMTATKGGASITFDFYTYPNASALQQDWDAQNGHAPRIKVGTDAFRGAAIYWNGNSVLVIAGAGAASPLAGEVANVYLGPGGSGGLEPGGTGTVAPPNTGSAGPQSPADRFAAVRVAMGGLFVVALLGLGLSVYASVRHGSHDEEGR